MRDRLGRERRGFGIAAGQLNDPFLLPAAQERGQFGRDIAERLPGQGLGALPDQAFGGGIGEKNAMLRIDRDDRRGDAAQHCLDKAAPHFELLIDVDERARLSLKLLGHAVEGARQHGNLVVAGRRRDAHRQIAPRRGARRDDQGAERPRDAVGDNDRSDNCKREQQKRAEIERAVELELELLRSLEQIVIVGEHRAGAHRLLEPRHIGVARRIDISPRLARKFCHGFDAVGLNIHDDLFAGVEALDRRRRQAAFDCAFVGVDHRGRARNAVGSDLDDRGFVQAAHHNLLEIIVGKFGTIDRNAAELVAQILSHREGIGADFALIFLIIALRQTGGIFEHAARAIREPEIDAELEQQRGEDHHEQRRRCSDQGKQRHETHMQPPVAAVHRAFGARTGYAAADQDDERHRGDEIGDHDRRDERRGQQTLALRVAGDEDIRADRNTRDQGERIIFGRAEPPPAAPRVRITGFAVKSRGERLRHCGCDTTILLHRKHTICAGAPISVLFRSTGARAMRRLGMRRIDVELPQSLAQRVAVDPEPSGCLELVAAYFAQHAAEQRGLDDGF